MFFLFSGFAVRLGKGSDPNQYWGEVNVRRKGIWGQVCAMGDNWNNNSAEVSLQIKNTKTR